MKKIILMLLLQFTALMAITYNVTNEGQMIPVTEDQSPTPEVTTPSTETVVVSTPETSTVETTSSAKTDWGFQPFSIPSNSVTVKAGGDIEAAINSLPNGGTVNLEAGTYYVNDVRFKSNIVLQGMGIEKTLLKFDTSGAANVSLLHASASSTAVNNIIIRDMKVDCTGNGNANGIELNVGVNNILVENIEVFNAGKSNLIIYNYNRAGETKRATYRNILSYNAGIHNISMRYVTGAVIENCEAYGSAIEYGIDLSNVIYGEVVNCNSHDNAYGTKFPAGDYIYIHDTIIQNNAKVGIQFNRISNTNPSAHFHIENVSIINSVSATDWGDTLARPTFAEFVSKGNTFEGNKYNYFRLGGVVDGHEYSTDIGLLQKRLTNDVINVTTHTNTDEVAPGYTSWPAF